MENISTEYIKKIGALLNSLSGTGKLVAIIAAVIVLYVGGVYFDKVPPLDELVFEDDAKYQQVIDSLQNVIDSRELHSDSLARLIKQIQPDSVLTKKVKDFNDEIYSYDFDTLDYDEKLRAIREFLESRFRNGE